MLNEQSGNIMQDKLTFVIPTRNNLDFLKLAVQSIRRLETRPNILVLDDASTDGTLSWLSEDSEIIVYKNPGPDRIGIVGMFNKGIELAPTNVVCAFHADMVASNNLDVDLLNLVKPKTMVCPTRIEPPFQPRQTCTVTMPLGDYPSEFSFDMFEKTVNRARVSDRLSPGIFAPWCMLKSDFLEIGGHDELFAPQSREDTDLFCTALINGFSVFQTWNSFVYHFTCRGSRYSPHSGGGILVDSPEWQKTNYRNSRNFIRKWGHEVQIDRTNHGLMPIIIPKVKIKLLVSKCTLEYLQVVEPWCEFVATDLKSEKIDQYVNAENLDSKNDKTEKLIRRKLTTTFGAADAVVKINLKNISDDVTEMFGGFMEVLNHIYSNANNIKTMKIGGYSIHG